MSDSAPPLASRLGRYEVIARLGKGGMAFVHLAISRGVGGFHKLVVLKRLDAADAGFRGMFLDEARLAALLHHPNVVHTYEVSETDGEYFIAMEYLEGQALDKVIRELRARGKMLAPRIAVRVVVDALAGLHYAHELKDYDGVPLGVVHRDVSPHNLFVTYQGDTKLLDFGVAQTVIKTSTTDVGMLKGKLAYMAPEQAASLPVDRCADIYSMGVVLWELLTLERLRKADSPAGVLDEALHARVPDLGRVRPGLGVQLDNVLWRALAPHPARRFQNAHDMREALLEYLAGEPCSHEEVAEFLEAHFGAEREQTRRRVARCLHDAQAQKPTSSVNANEAPSSVLPFGIARDERSLPLLDAPSLPAAADDATKPFLPDVLRLSSAPPRVESRSSGARSRSLSGEGESVEGSLLHRLWLAGGLLLTVASFFFWSRGPAAEPTGARSRVQASVALDPEVLLRLQGSNTIGEELAPRLAQAFLTQQGYTDVERGAPGEATRVTARDPRDGRLRQVEIVARGSATAFSGLAAGVCDVGMSSRRVKPEEVQLLREKGLGDVSSPAGENVVGLDGIAVIVHPNSPLSHIDIATLRRLFTGQVVDYAQIGAGAGPVHLYVRDERSGTFDTFQHLVAGERQISANAKRFSDSVELSSAVARDPQGIGFIGIPYVRRARALAVAAPGAAALFPSTFTVATEGYELSRRLYLYVPVQGVKPLALEFVNYALSAPGQEVVKASGFVDLTLRAMQPGQCPRCPGAYGALARVGKRLSLDFRFVTGSARLDNRGQRDLERLMAFLRESAHSKLVLVGFSDGRGSSGQNVTLSLERAVGVAEELRARGVRAVETLAMGSLLPVASNESESGREKNRRVEVWLR